MKRTLTRHLLTGIIISAHRETIEEGPEKSNIVTMLEIEDPESGESWTVPLRSDVRDALIQQMTGGVVPATEADLLTLVKP